MCNKMALPKRREPDISTHSISGVPIPTLSQTLNLTLILTLTLTLTLLNLTNLHCNGKTIKLTCFQRRYPRCTDTSDPRHFGPKTLRHHRDWSQMSGQFGLVPKCLCDNSAPVPNCLHLVHFLVSEARILFWYTQKIYFNQHKYDNFERFHIVIICGNWQL